MSRSELLPAMWLGCGAQASAGSACDFGAQPLQVETHRQSHEGLRQTHRSELLRTACAELAHRDHQFGEHGALGSAR